MNMGLHHFGMTYGWLFQIIILVLFFAIVFWMIKNNNNYGYKTGNESAQDILKKRLAAGEIKIKEYNKLRKEIEKNGD